MQTVRYAALCLALAFGQVGAAPFALGESGVSFDAPQGFTALSSAQIAQKFPTNRAPAFVVGDGPRTTTIAYDLKPQHLPIDKLHEVMAAYVGVFDRVVPGIEWREKKLIQLRGQAWIYLEMTSRAVDTDIHNIMLVTALRDKTLVFNFNSTKAEFSKNEAALRKSIQSIALPRS